VKAHAVLDYAGFLSRAEGYPAPEVLDSALRDARLALSMESPDQRPRDKSGFPGGLVRLDQDLVIIVPDLHARSQLLYSLAASFHPDHPSATVAELAHEGVCAIVCLGDVLHTEGAEGVRRWREAARNLVTGREGLLSAAMDQEMGASLHALLLVIFLKTALGKGFHCLKGNHDNLTNSSEDGDLPFYKYAMEGSMGAAWFNARYGDGLGEEMRRYERSLALVAAGRDFCASHAEPLLPVNPAELLEYRSNPGLVRSLIWTGNGEAAEGSVEASLDALLGPGAGPRAWISGHRPVAGSFEYRAGRKLLQIHNPERTQVACLRQGRTKAGMIVELYKVGHPGSFLQRVDSACPG
jgi:hypothetical protein